MQTEDDYYDENINEEDSKPDEKFTLDLEIISECISLLKRLGSELEYAYIKVDCSNRNLGDINLLKEYIHLRFVILSSNFITDLEPLQSIKNLLYVNASNNQICLTNPINSLKYLQYLDLSSNKIKAFNIRDLPLLRILKLSDNIIESLQIVDKNKISSLTRDQLPQLNFLSINSNKLDNLLGIENLPNLKFLYASQNSITNLNYLPSSLTHLHTRNNQIIQLNGLDTTNLVNLSYINLRGNYISKFYQIKKLKSLTGLKILLLLDNPITSKENYQQIVIGILNQLERLDKEPITLSDRKQASDLLSYEPALADDETDNEQDEEGAFHIRKSDEEEMNLQLNEGANQSEMDE